MDDELTDIYNLRIDYMKRQLANEIRICNALQEPRFANCDRETEAARLRHLHTHKANQAGIVNEIRFLETLRDAEKIHGEIEGAIENEDPDERENEHA